MKQSKVQKLIEIKRYYNYANQTYYVDLYEFDYKTHNSLKKPVCFYKVFNSSNREKLINALDDMDGEVMLKYGSEGILNFVGSRVFYSKEVKK